MGRRFEGSIILRYTSFKLDWSRIQEVETIEQVLNCQ
jgi:hypothetical protein